MYKGSSDKLSYIDRVASHSTKARPSGRIDDIPAWAREPEEYYNSVRDQYRLLADQLAKIQHDLAAINEKMKVKAGLPFKEFEHLRKHKERLAAKFTALKPQAGAYREIARAAGERAWASVFFHLAQMLLTPDDFRILLKETQELLGRNQVEITKGDGEYSEERREAIRRSEQRKKRRRRFRQHHGGNVVVWSDNKPVQQKYEDEMRSQKS
jgi:hypothetical protein